MITEDERETIGDLFGDLEELFYDVSEICKKLHRIFTRFKIEDQTSEEKTQ